MELIRYCTFQFGSFQNADKVPIQYSVFLMLHPFHFLGFSANYRTVYCVQAMMF